MCNCMFCGHKAKSRILNQFIIYNCSVCGFYTIDNYEITDRFLPYLNMPNEQEVRSDFVTKYSSFLFYHKKTFNDYCNKNRFFFGTKESLQLLNAINKEIYVTRAFLVVAIFDAIFDIITIPYLGCNGAAIATLISEMIICVMFAYPIIKSKYCPDFKLLKTVLKLVVSTIITGLIIYFLNLNMWLAIPIGAIIYFICIVLTRTMDVTDKYVIKQLLGKN